MIFKIYTLGTTKKYILDNVSTLFENRISLSRNYYISNTTIAILLICEKSNLSKKLKEIQSKYILPILVYVDNKIYKLVNNELVELRKPVRVSDIL